MADDAPRTAELSRETGETTVSLRLALDGEGAGEIRTGVGFLDHMLTLLARHGLFDLTVTAEGDTHVDDHHTAEDVGIVLGRAVREAVGDKRGIRRYGDATVPMDETLVTAAVDLSGRACLVDRVPFPTEKIGSFDTQLVNEFWRAFAGNALANLHLVLHHGTNSHHIAEATFKATARALRAAVERDPRQTGVPSSKGVL